MSRPSYNPSRHAATPVGSCVVLAAWLIGSAGCTTSGSKDQSLDSLTKAPVPYPTAIDTSAPPSAGKSTPAPASDGNQLADKAETVAASSQPVEIANQPYKSTPLQLPEKAAQPIPLASKQDIPTPLPLAPHQRPNNYAVAVAPPQPKQAAESVAAPAAAPSDAPAADSAQPQVVMPTEASPTSPAAVQPESATDQQSQQQTVETTASYAPAVDSLLAPAIGATSVASASAATGFPAPSVVPAADELATSSIYSPAGTLPPPVETEPAVAAMASGNSSSANAEAQVAPPTLEKHRAGLIEALETAIRQRRDAKADQAEIARLELQLRLLYLLAERPDDAVAAIEDLSPPERESCKHLLFGLAAFMVDEPPSRAAHRNAKILRSLRDATSELAAGSRLDLRNMAFCEKVEYFGWYTQFPRYEFTPKQQVILYVEVENYAAEAKGPQSFETELQGSYQIFDASGQIVAERKLPLDREVCRNYRRDYFLAYRIYMPDSIAAGSYRLELTLEDLKARGQFQGRKLGQGTIDFSIR